MFNETYNLNSDVVIKLHDEFDADAVKAMKSELEKYSELKDNILIDLKNVSFIDSSGIGAIVFLYKRMVSKGQVLSVVGLTKQPLELFQMLLLDKTINCFEDIESYLTKTLTVKVG